MHDSLTLRGATLCGVGLAALLGHFLIPGERTWTGSNTAARLVAAEGSREAASPAASTTVNGLRPQRGPRRLVSSLQELVASGHVSLATDGLTPGESIGGDGSTDDLPIEVVYGDGGDDSGGGTSGIDLGDSGGDVVDVPDAQTTLYYTITSRAVWNGPELINEHGLSETQAVELLESIEPGMIYMPYSTFGGIFPYLEPSLSARGQVNALIELHLSGQIAGGLWDRFNVYGVSELSFRNMMMEIYGGGLDFGPGFDPIPPHQFTEEEYDCLFPYYNDTFFYLLPVPDLLLVYCDESQPSIPLPEPINAYGLPLGLARFFVQEARPGTTHEQVLCIFSRLDDSIQTAAQIEALLATACGHLADHSSGEPDPTPSPEPSPTEPEPTDPGLETTPSPEDPVAGDGSGSGSGGGDEPSPEPSTPEPEPTVPQLTEAQFYLPAGEEPSFEGGGWAASVLTTQLQPTIDALRGLIMSPASIPGDGASAAEVQAFWQRIMHAYRLELLLRLQRFPGIFVRWTGSEAKRLAFAQDVVASAQALLQRGELPTGTLASLRFDAHLGLDGRACGERMVELLERLVAFSDTVPTDQSNVDWSDYSLPAPVHPIGAAPHNTRWSIGLRGDRTPPQAGAPLDPMVDYGLAYPQEHDGSFFGLARAIPRPTYNVSAIRHAWLEVGHIGSSQVAGDSVTFDVDVWRGTIRRPQLLRTESVSGGLRIVDRGDYRGNWSTLFNTWANGGAAYRLQYFTR